MEEQPVSQTTRIAHFTCPVCGGTNLDPILQIPQIPILANVLWDTREEALATPRGDMDLVFCHDCGHVFNQAFDPSATVYDAQYENSLHFSPRFQEYAHWLAQYLVEQHDLHGKAIVEIGSGKGDFLKLLCQVGGNTGTGFDPSYEPLPGEHDPNVSFIRDVYSDRYAGFHADFICSRHTLEHMPQPAAFVQSLRQTIGNRKHMVVFVEVPNLAYILRDTAIWDIIYEHYSYFSPQSLANLFSHNGFHVRNVAETYEGQFLFLEAAPGDGLPSAPNTPFTASMDPLAQQVAQFGKRSQDKIARWKEDLNELQRQGKRVVLWGAGSKGISFLNLLHADAAVQYIIDINPRKREKFVTGAGQQIVPPEFLKTYQPDVVVIMNPIYEQEIRQTVESMGLQPQIRFA